MSNESKDMNNSDKDFDLFAQDVDDNLEEQLAKGSYRWTNKYTAALSVLVLISASLSGGIWYGNKHASSSASNSLAGFASRIRGAAAGGAFTGAADPAALAAGAAGAATAGGFAGAAGVGGLGGGARITGTVTKVSGTSITINLDTAPTTPIATGDSVSVRATGGGAAAGAPATGSGTTATRKKGTAATGTTGTSTATKPTGGGAAAGPAGAPQGAGGGGGGRFNNPEFLACLTKNGVTLDPGTRPDRTDPKIAAALQTCAATLGLPAAGGGGAAGGAAGGGGGAAGGGGRAKPSPTATP